MLESAEDSLEGHA